MNGKIRKSFTIRLQESKRGENECWNWTGHIGKNGYSYSCYMGKSTTAYRASWMHLVGPIPDGYEIDHLCKNPRCVNPAHLEPVPPYVNNMRSRSPASLCAKKTHCLNGHEFTTENTAIIIRSGGKSDRRCKKCHAERARQFNRKISARKLEMHGVASPECPR